jgi:hypothetical protein
LKIREIEYSRTFNLGQYESERISLRVELDETDDLNKAFNEVKTHVFQLHKEKRNLDIIQKVKERFLDKWVERIEFSRQGNFIIVKTKQYLNTDDFEELRAVIRDFGGEYVSAGKESHFKIPL